MAIESNRWGIIYCPKESVRRTHKYWENIKKYLDEKEVLYDFVQSEGRDSVERLAAMLTSNGYKTLIIVGGDAALNRAVNGAFSVCGTIQERPVIGVIPYGLANDFARFWGFDEDDYKRTIDSLIKRRIRRVDAGVCTYQGAEGTERRYFMNCVNVGLVANIMDIRYKTHAFWGLRTLSFISSIFMVIFQRMENKMRLKVNQDLIDRRLVTVCIGSALGYGQTPSAVPYNGMLDVSVVSYPKVMQLLQSLWMLVSGRFLNSKTVKAFRTRKVLIEDYDRAKVSLDGAVWMQASVPLEVTIQHESVEFLIP